MASETGETRNGLIQNAKLQCNIRWLMLFLTFVALIFATTTLISCQLIIIKTDNNVSLFGTNQDVFPFGYFQVAEYSDGKFHHCRLYYETERDAELGPGDDSFEAGKAFAILTMIFAFFANLIACFVMLFHFTHRTKLWWLLRILLPLTLIFQCLSLLVYDTEFCKDASDLDGVDNCVPDGAGVVQIVNIFLLLLASLFVVAVPAPDHPVFQFWSTASDAPATTMGKVHPGDDHSHDASEEVAERT